MSRYTDDLLRRAIVDFVDSHSAEPMRRFKDSIAVWRDVDNSNLTIDDVYSCVDARDLPATAQLPRLATQTTLTTDSLFTAFREHSKYLHWEQSYTEADSSIGRDMLDGYAFAEIIGKHGPWRSERVRCGIGIWGPGIDYPIHRHRAEEIYVVLAGAADFYVDMSVAKHAQTPGSGDLEYDTVEAGGTVLVRSMQAHGLRTYKHGVAVFYVWQHGDMRQKSYFLTA